MRITNEQAAEINGILSTGAYITEYVRKAAKTEPSPNKEGKIVKPARGVPFGILVATKVAGNRILISGATRRKNEKHDALELKRIALARLAKGEAKWRAIMEGRVVVKEGEKFLPLLPASLKEPAYKFASRALKYFVGGLLLRPEFKDYTPSDVRKLVDRTPKLSRSDMEELGEVMEQEEREFMKSLPEW